MLGYSLVHFLSHYELSPEKPKTALCVLITKDSASDRIKCSVRQTSGEPEGRSEEFTYRKIGNLRNLKLFSVLKIILSSKNFKIQVHSIVLCKWAVEYTLQVRGNPRPNITVVCFQFQGGKSQVTKFLRILIVLWL